MAPPYPTSESTAIFNYFHRLKEVFRNSMFERSLTRHKFQLSGLQAVIKLLFSFQ